MAKSEPRNVREPHANECYSCEYGGFPPASTAQCKGCINKDNRPHWVMRIGYVSMAAAALAKARTTRPYRATDGGNPHTTLDRE